MTAGVLTWLVLLPCATWLLGHVLALLDGGHRPTVLRRIAWRGLPFLAAGWLLGGAVLLPALAALATALALHVAALAGLRAFIRRGAARRNATVWWDDRGE